MKNGYKARAKQQAEKLFPGQNTWQELYVKGFMAGCGHVEQENYKNKIDGELGDLIKENELLSQYKKEMEEILYDPERLADLIGGL